MDIDQLIEDMKAEIEWEQEQFKREILEQWEENPNKRSE